MKFTKCVLGANYIPVGFVYENHGIERYEDFASLCRSNASDGNLYFSESGVFGLSNHKENGIAICRETVGGGYSDPVDPSLTLMQRIISGGKVVGFVVQDSTGTEVKKHIASILSASKYMTPANYKVVERNGNQFLQGKGVRLSSLPEIDLTPGLTNIKKPRTVRNEPHDTVDPKLKKGISLVNLVDLVAKCGGAVLKMPADTYKPVGETHVVDGMEFTRSKGMCEVSPAILEAATKTLSASFNYRVIGTIMTSENPALAYIYRKKNIVKIHYDNGVLRGDKVRLERFGIAIPDASLQKFHEGISGTVAVTPLENKSAEDTATRLLKMVSPKIYEVNLSEISLLGPEYEDYLMAGVQIKDTLEHIAKHKYIATFLKHMIKGLRDSGVSLGPVPLWKYYAGFSPASLAELRDSGVDTSTGLYTSFTRASAPNKAAVEKTADVEIEYKLESKITPPKDTSTVMQMSITDLPSEVQNALGQVLSEIDPAAKLKLADTIKQKSETAFKKSERKLFYHKVAMLLDGSNAVHNHDRSEWESASVSSRAQFVKYTHASGIAVQLRQITMSK